MHPLKSARFIFGLIAFIATCGAVAGEAQTSAVVEAQTSAVVEAQTSAVVGLWKINWEKSPPIAAVPQRMAHRFRTVEDFRQFVADRSKGLTLEIRADRTATLTYATGNNPTFPWEPAQQHGYDIWMRSKSPLSGGIGHGFTLSKSDPNTGILNFQVEWAEDVATRVPLLLERQPPVAAQPK